MQDKELQDMEKELYSEPNENIKARIKQMDEIIEELLKNNDMDKYLN